MTHRVYSKIDRPDPAIVARFLNVKFEMIAEFVAPKQLMDIAIKPLGNREMRFAGPAVTVALECASTFMGYASVGVAQAGDVIVVAARGDCSLASWGGGLSMSAQNLGCAGVVVDGAVIDAPSILSRGVPVFARVATFAHSPKKIPGSINIPAVCGGVLVHPGDIVVGDLDGVMVVPRDDAETVLIEAEKKSVKIAGFAERLMRTGETLLDLNGGRKMITDEGIEWIG